MNDLEKLQHQFKEKREDLGRIQLDIKCAEMGQFRHEKYTGSWQVLEDHICGLRRKEKLIRSRLASLKIDLLREAEKIGVELWQLSLA